jgi:hypothetical protein
MPSDAAGYGHNLLRMLIGYFHTSLSEQVALVRHGEGFHALTKEEREQVQADVLQRVLEVARSADENMLKNLLRTPPQHTDFAKPN